MKIRSAVLACAFLFGAVAGITSADTAETTRLSLVGRVLGAQSDIITLWKTKRVNKILNNSIAGVDKCSSVYASDPAREISCFVQYATSVYRKEGLSETLTLIEELSESQKRFRSVCHDILHKVGWLAYEDYKRGITLPLDESSTMCGYGLYHGLTEQIASRRESFSGVRTVCTSIDSRVLETYPDTYYQCFHGLGHGAVYTDNRQLWGSVSAMTQRARTLCDEASRNPEELFRCATGMFDGIAIAMGNGDYGLSVDTDRPYGICESEHVYEYQKACYTSLNPIIQRTFSYDLSRLIPYIAAIPDRKLSEEAMLSVATARVELAIHADPETYEKTVKFYKNGASYCVSLSPDIVEACLKSIAYALSFSQEDGDWYRDGLEFCRSGTIDASLKRSCIDSVVFAVIQSNGIRKQRTLCKSLPEAERGNLCEK